MSWLKLKRPMDESTSVDYGDIVQAKRALNQLGYYRPPIGNELGAWVDNNLFDGIRRFQRDNRLRVDGVMKPGGPTETAINRQMSRDSISTPVPRNLLSFERTAGCSCTEWDDQPWKSY